MEYYKWNKGQSRHLGYNFISLEFDCQCKYVDCIGQRIAKTLIDKLDAVRNETRHPLFITSGYRCPKHQNDLTNTPGMETVANSTHCLGHAADIRTSADNADVIIQKHFKAIGRAKRFWHVDLRGQDDGRERRWSYK